MKNSSCLSQERNMHRTIKTVENISKQICRWILIWEDNRGWTFVTGGSVIVDCGLLGWYLTRSDGLKFKIPSWSICFLQNIQLLTLQDINRWTVVMWVVEYYNFFISYLDSQSDGTHSLHAEVVSKWCNAKFLQICSNETDSSTSWMIWG